VALISETLDAVLPQRRRAAHILLDLARSGSIACFPDDHIAAIRERAGASVAAEAQGLLRKFGAAGQGEAS
jgi:hypothetical protein